MVQNEYSLYSTTEYSLFMRLKGNRAVERSRVEKIKNSIKRVGYIISLIIVNEKYEVIDGQARLQASTEFGFPVYYIICPNIGIKECISMNIHQSNWKTIDYIKSYAEQGDPNYVRLYRLLTKYSKNHIDIKVITCSLEKGKSEISIQTIIDGGLTVTDTDKQLSYNCLDYVSEFMDTFHERNITSLRAYQSALIWIFFSNIVDNDRMLEKFKRYKTTLTQVNDINQASAVLEEIYNFKGRDRTYFAHEMKRDRMEYARAKGKGGRPSEM